MYLRRAGSNCAADTVPALWLSLSVCSYTQSCHADFLLLAAAVVLLRRIPAHQLPVGPAVILLLLIDGRLVHAPLEAVRLFALWPLPGHLKKRREGGVGNLYTGEMSQTWFKMCHTSSFSVFSYKDHKGLNLCLSLHKGENFLPIRWYEWVWEKVWKREQIPALMS